MTLAILPTRRDTAPPGSTQMLTDAAIQSHADRIHHDGYTVIEGAASA